MCAGLGRRRAAEEKKRAREDKLHQEKLNSQYKKAWLEVRDTEYPARPEEMEQFFLNNITEAEALHAKGAFPPLSSTSHTCCGGSDGLSRRALSTDWLILGPSQYLSAAQCFYKALKVYPNTPDLLEIYKKTISEVPLPLHCILANIDGLGMFCDGSRHAGSRRGANSFRIGDEPGGLIIVLHGRTKISFISYRFCWAFS